MYYIGAFYKPLHFYREYGKMHFDLVKFQAGDIYFYCSLDLSHSSINHSTNGMYAITLGTYCIKYSERPSYIRSTTHIE